MNGNPVQGLRAQPRPVFETKKEHQTVMLPAASPTHDCKFYGYAAASDALRKELHKQKAEAFAPA